MKKHKPQDQSILLLTIAAMYFADEKRVSEWRGITTGDKYKQKDMLMSQWANIPSVSGRNSPTTLTALGILDESYSLTSEYSNLSSEDLYYKIGRTLIKNWDLFISKFRNNFISSFAKAENVLNFFFENIELHENIELRAKKNDKFNTRWVNMPNKLISSMGLGYKITNTEYFYIDTGNNDRTIFYDSVKLKSKRIYLNFRNLSQYPNLLEENFTVFDTVSSLVDSSIVKDRTDIGEGKQIQLLMLSTLDTKNKREIDGVFRGNHDNLASGNAMYSNATLKKYNLPPMTKIFPVLKGAEYSIAEINDAFSRIVKGEKGQKVAGSWSKTKLVDMPITKIELDLSKTHVGKSARPSTRKGRTRAENEASAIKAKETGAKAEEVAFNKYVEGDAKAIFAKLGLDDLKVSDFIKTPDDNDDAGADFVLSDPRDINTPLKLYEIKMVPSFTSVSFIFTFNELKMAYKYNDLYYFVLVDKNENIKTIKGKKLLEECEFTPISINAVSREHDKDKNIGSLLQFMKNQ